ncbi:MAG: glutathione S-transferase family protein [Burkholderiales bacterium]
MLRLCGFRVSNYHNKVRLQLLEKGIAHEEDSTCRPTQNEEWLARSPMGKVPVLETDQGRICESQVICEYIEDAYPQKPLLPADPFARAKVRELTVVIELHLELVARRLYGQAFFGRAASEETRAEVAKEIAKGARALKALAVFDPFIAGKELTLADCAAAVSLPIVSLATKIVLGRDALEDLPQLKPYLKMLRERPAFATVDADRKAASEAAAKK